MSKFNLRNPNNLKERKTLNGFMNSFKKGLIDMFNEEEDSRL